MSREGIFNRDSSQSFLLLLPHRSIPKDVEGREKTKKGGNKEEGDAGRRTVLLPIAAEGGATTIRRYRSPFSKVIFALHGLSVQLKIGK